MGKIIKNDDIILYYINKYKNKTLKIIYDLVI